MGLRSLAASDRTRPSAVATSTAAPVVAGSATIRLSRVVSASTVSRGTGVVFITRRRTRPTSSARMTVSRSRTAGRARSPGRSRSNCGTNGSARERPVNGSIR